MTRDSLYSDFDQSGPFPFYRVLCQKCKPGSQVSNQAGNQAGNQVGNQVGNQLSRQSSGQSGGHTGTSDHAYAHRGERRAVHRNRAG